MPVRVTLEGAKKPLEGTISAVDPTIDSATRNVKLRAAIPDLAETTRPGMFVNVQVITPEQKAVVSVPATAIVHASFGDSVFVIEDKKPGSPGMDKTPDGKPVKVARQQFVRVGAMRGDFVAISKGVTAGQQVVSAGAFKLRNNSPVVVDNTAPVLGDVKALAKGTLAHIDLRAVDRTSTIASLEYSVDSSTDWQSVLPSDNIADSPDEAYSFDTQPLSSGVHQITVRASDAHGNQAHESVTITVEAPTASK